jgi:competence protein ComEA
MIFTPEERRALLALGAVLVFGQALAWLEDWKEHAPDRELAAWLDQVRHVQAEADSAAVLASGSSASDDEPAPNGIAARGAMPDNALGAARDAVVGPVADSPFAADASPEGAAPSAPPDDATDSGLTSGSGGPRPKGAPLVLEEPLSALPPGILETGRIRIDLATAEELTTLPGIGPSLAARIIAARADAPFRAVDDLLRVKGIGPKTLDRLRDHVSVESPPADADSSRGEQHVDAAENRRRSEARSGGPHQ